MSILLRLVAGVVFVVMFLVRERLDMPGRQAIRLGLGSLLTLYSFVNLFAVHSYVRRSCNTQANLVATYIDDGNLYLVSDHNSFVALSGQHQHRELLPWSLLYFIVHGYTKIHHEVHEEHEVLFFVI